MAQPSRRGRREASLPAGELATRPVGCARTGASRGSRRRWGPRRGRRAHARVALIHPFRDGNGRVAHALVPVILRERGLLSQPCLLLGAAFRSRKRAYFAALDRLWSDDAAPWMAFFLSTVEEAAMETAAVCQAILERFEADARRLRRGGARRLLGRLAEGGASKLRGGRCAGETPKSSATARILFIRISLLLAEIWGLLYAFPERAQTPGALLSP